ncbi:MAG: oligosaccharide flippase family protein [Candidatus Pacearchaeota archaeon]
MNNFKNFSKNELIRGGLILLILLNVGNLVNYLFQFILARMLGPEDYAVLAVVTSMIYLFNVPTMSIQTVVSKYTTSFVVRKEFGKIKSLMGYLTKRILLIALIAFILFSLLSLILTDLLKISIGILIFTGLVLFGAFIYPIGIGILQGLKKFKSWGINFILISIIKILIAVSLVLVGFRVYGAIVGFIAANILGFLLILPEINNILKTHDGFKEKIKILNQQNIITFLAILMITILYTLDVVLAKIFFKAELVGQYAVLSMIGKMILFSTMAISLAMFPISSERFETGTKTKSIIKKSIILVSGLCLTAVLLFYFFPQIIISILFGMRYTSVGYLLVYVGIAFSFLSLLNLFILYKISINTFKIKHLFVLGLFLVMQVAILINLHQTIQDFSISFMFSTIITFIGALILMRS